MIADTLRSAVSARGLRGGIDAALDFLGSVDLDALATGRHEIEGERLYALVQDYQPAAPTTKKFEGHRRYIDVQYVHRGREAAYWIPASRLRRPGPYSTESDALLFDDALAGLPATALGLDAGCFAVFFPEDAHMPGCLWAGMAAAEEQVRKIVVKVLLRGR